MRTFFAAVIKNCAVSEEFVELTLSAPELFEVPVSPGMFVHVQVPQDASHLLRRPVSIMDADEKNKTLTLGIRPRGEGTRAICAVQPGDQLDLLGPLGVGFTVGDAKHIWIAGGGIGAAPLLFAAKQFQTQAELTAFLGFRTKEQIILKERFESFGVSTVLCTDDGSAGFHGTVCGAMESEASTPDRILACGPTPMLKAVQAFALRQNIPCRLSLEERMGCGFGACLTCSCKMKRADGSETYGRVCADGPVFDAKEVVL